MRITETIEYVPPNELKPHPMNGVLHSPLTETERTLLRKSIEEFGIRHPIWITEEKTIVSGHERWKISMEQQFKQVPVQRVLHATEEEVLYLLVSSNEGRRGTETDLIKKAKKIEILYRHYGIRHGNNQKTRQGDVSYQEIANLLNMSPRSVQRLLKLLRLIPELQKLVSEQVIGLTAGNVLAALTEDEQRMIHQTIQRANLKQVKTAEIEAIRDELEYLRERKIQKDAEHRAENNEQGINEDCKDFEHQEEEEDTILVEQHSPTKNDSKENDSVEENRIAVRDEIIIYTEDAPPENTIEAIVPLLQSDNAQNVRRRIVLQNLDKVERQIDTWKERVIPELEVGDPYLKRRIHQLVEQLEEFKDLLINGGEADARAPGG